MMFFERYDKNVMEEFALRVISKSYDSEFSTYIYPKNKDNFDFVSSDGKKALEITTVIPENVKQVYIYEKQLYSGKKVDSNKIQNVKLKETGEIDWYYTEGTLPEIKNKVIKALKTKNQKAIKRKENSCVDIVDLCVCIDDNIMYDLDAFKFTFYGFEEYVFRNIFFITGVHFIRYSRECGFEEYKRIM